VLVLGSSRTGLIFTGLQEGTEPAGLTQPGQTEQGIPYHVLSCWVPVRGSWATGTQSRLRSSWQRRLRRAALWVLQFVLCILLIGIVVVLFPLFAVLLNCPYPDPPVFACFFPFSSTPQRGEGQSHGTVVASCS